MTSEEAVLAVIKALNATGTPFMLVGSLASNLHGIPRATQDADFVIQITGASIRQIVGLLGPAFRFDPQLTFETVTMTYKYLLQVPEIPFRIELFLLSDDPHDRARFERRLSVPVYGGPAYVATAEDMIIMKLRWIGTSRRTKDVDDVINMLAMRMDDLDWRYIEDWCQRHGTEQLLEELRAQVK